MNPLGGEGSIAEKMVSTNPGADLGFSRGGGGGADFQKKIQKFCLFFRLTKLIFRALPKYYKEPVLAKISAPLAKF